MNSICRKPALALAIFVTATAAHAAATIWNGPDISFTKANFANPSLPANQDRITATLWLTRGSSQGLFNAETESAFAHFFSPQDTQWADGTLANYSTLSYHDWNSWAKGVHGGPETTIGVPAVVHIVDSDIYFSIRFTSWTSGGAGGGFSYTRSTFLAVPEPASGLLLVMGAAVAWIRAKRP